MRRLASTMLLAGLLVPVFACGGGSEAEDVKLDVVKQKEIAKALESARGKVVLLDVWGEF